jgi:putative salt-induced outer membrane protein YdiY
MRNFWIVLLASSLASGLAVADEMVMKNGSRIVGKLISASDGKIEFETPWGGTLKVNGANVESISTDQPSVVMMDDGEIFKDKVLYATQETVTMQREGQPPRSYAVAAIKYVNPEPWQLGEGYRWTGRTSAAFEAERGNSDTDEWDVDFRTEWRSLEDRLVIRGNAEYDEANGNKVTENWEVRNKYDRFLGDDPDNYWGGKLRLEYDKFADLDLRTLVGPHIGRQFFETRLLDLKGEIGPVYVDEQFDEAEDNDYFGALLEFEAESDILGFGTTIYMLHDTTLNFDSIDEPLSNTTIGLRMPLIFGFETAFQARIEYNGSAPDDVDTTDETYSFRIGYAW